MTYLRRELTLRLIVGCVAVCVGSAIFFKQLAFAFVISARTDQIDLPHVCRPFVNAMLGSSFLMGKLTCTVAHAPNIRAFIFLTRQTFEMGMDQFLGKVAKKYVILRNIIDLLPFDKCFTTIKLTPIAASPSLAS